MTQESGLLDLKRIKQDADFEVVLAHYGINVTQKGDERIGCCPFHTDTKASFHANVKKRNFNCFGCGTKGNILDFVAKAEAVGVRAAAMRLAEICGLELEPIGESEGPETRTAPEGVAPPQGAQRAVKQRPNPSHRSAGAAKAGNRRSFSEKKPGSEEQKGDSTTGNRPLDFALHLDGDHPYLATRGLTRATVDHFELGCAEKGLMRGRLAIPIHNEVGELVAYAGRWVGNDDELAEGEGKYKLPPRFQRRHVLFNLHRVDSAAKQVIVVEGFFDCIWLWQQGYHNVVAVMGSELATDQAQLLASRFKGVVLFLDGDDAGEAASRTMATNLLELGLWVKVVRPPAGAQPDGLDATALKTLLG